MELEEIRSFGKARRIKNHVTIPCMIWYDGTMGQSSLIVITKHTRHGSIVNGRVLMSIYHGFYHRWLATTVDIIIRVIFC